MSEEEPTILVLGGTGFIGRNLVHYLVQNDISKKIRVADKVMKSMAWMNEQHKNSFSKVEFKHANLINEKTVRNVFTQDDGSSFDYVINCAGETKPGQSEAVYKDGIEKLSLRCAQEAARQHVKRYIEVSTAYMQDVQKNPATEQDECHPWKPEAVHKLEVEKQLSGIQDLNYIVARPALVYGKAANTGVVRRLVIGGIYKYLNEKMQLLWTKDLRISTVHVDDVSKALWHLCLHGQQGQVYNLADKGFTTQGSLSSLISQIFNINYDYLGSLASSLAKLSLSEIAEDINEKHTVAWGEICQSEGINNTPLTPLVHEEHLLNKNLYVDGSKIESLGYQYKYPEVTVELLKEILTDYAEMKQFPVALLPWLQS